MDLIQLDTALLELDQTPLLGHIPSVPVEEIAATLADKFGLSSLSIVVSTPRLSGEEEIISNLGDIQVGLAAPGVGGQLMVATTSDHLQLLVAHILKDETAASALVDTELGKAFFEYFTLEVLDCLTTTKLNELGLKLRTRPDAWHGDGIEIALKLAIDQTVVSLSLVVSKEVAAGLRSHFQSGERSERVAHLRHSLPLRVRGICGHVDLGKDEFKAIESGDFIVLDECTLNPDTGEGPVEIVVGRHPLGQGKMTKSGIEL